MYLEKRNKLLYYNLMNKIIIYVIIILIILLTYKNYKKYDELYENTNKLNTICIVFVCNKKYLDKFINTCNLLLTNGQYKGNICLVIGDDLNNDDLLKNKIILDNNIIIKYFPDIQFNDNFLNINNKINSDGRNITKKFQWHKLHLFNTYFKQWDYIFYLDCGMNIFSDITPMINEAMPNTLLAHSDAYPTYERKLSCQFDNTNIEYYSKLNNTYNLDVDYFQSGILLYDTNIIENNTFDNLMNLSIEYPIATANEQSIMALYFTNIKPHYKQIKIKNKQTYFYDYCKRNNDDKYIMVKYL